ncbi:hypothetical protein LBMAG42_22940 [Deltaproteobacteria bacterium]|nr:hypothetical protein LBMAG42_22940 [Deltaproteobacteria bacterium]
MLLIISALGSLLACTVYGCADGRGVECGGPDTSPLDTSAGDTADSGDSADTGDTGPADMVVNYVITAYTVANRGEGFDLDGDGAVDNAVWPLGAVLDPLIAGQIATAQHVAIEQLSGVNDFSTDDAVRVGVVTAADPDGDGTNNASGTESFAGGAAVDVEGAVLVTTETALEGGAYTVSLATGSLPVGSYELEFATGLWIAAAPRAVGETGLIGFGVSVDALTIALEAEGTDAGIISTLVALADLDLDSDGEPDAVSMAFAFEAAPCFLVP